MKIFFLTLIMSTSIIQGDKIMNKNSIESLHLLEGNWSIENYTLKGEKWESIGNTSSKIKLEHEGRFIVEKVKYLTKFGEINMITNIGYDKRLMKFKLCAMDKEYGNMDIYYGEWDNENLIFVNLKSDMPVILDDGKEMFFRLTYSEISKQSFTHLVEGTIDKGVTWFSFSKGKFKKN